MRWTAAIEEGSHAVYIGLGAFQEWERLSPRAASPGRLNSSLTRASGYLVGERRFNASSRISGVAYVQPALRQMSDYRVLARGAWNIRIAEHLDWRVQVDYRFDARPPQGVRRTDVRYSAGVEWRLGP